jgi:hypothetical protein
VALWAADAVTSLVVLQPGVSPDGVSPLRFRREPVDPSRRALCKPPGRVRAVAAPAERIADSRFYRISNTSYTTLSARLSPTPIPTILLIQEYLGDEVSKNGAVRK